MFLLWSLDVIMEFKIKHCKNITKLDSCCLIFMYQYVGNIFFSYRKKNLDIIFAVKEICNTYFHVKQQKWKKKPPHFWTTSCDDRTLHRFKQNMLNYVLNENCISSTFAKYTLLFIRLTITVKEKELNLLTFWFVWTIQVRNGSDNWMKETRKTHPQPNVNHS